MKSLFKVLSLSVLAAFIAFGCANTSGDAVSNGAVGASRSSNKTITLVATGDAEAIKFPSNSGISATIVAAQIDAANDLKFYLFYENKVTGIKKVPTAPISFTATTASNIGTVPLNIEDGYYLFKLYATKTTITSPTEDTVKAAALFLGQTEADLRTAQDSVTFFLTSDTLTGSADVSIKLKTAGWTVPTTGYDVEACITKKTDGSLVGATSAQAIGAASITTSEPTAAQFSQSSVTAGTYNFEVRFTNTSTTKTYTWSDTIIVSPNNPIAKTVTIPPIIGSAPEAPLHFNATFKDPDSISAGRYNVEFSWDATASINETHFQIDLLEIPADTAWTAINASPATEWTDSYRTDLGNTGTNSLKSYGADFYGNETEGWVSGSLRKNNTSVVMSLELGKRYLARISAVNVDGNSPYLYVKFNDSVPDPVTTGYSKFDEHSKVINRYRLTYNVDGGTITPATGAASTANIVEYRTQNTVANSAAGTYVGAKITGGVDIPTADIWNPSTDTTTYTSLIKGTKAWTGWRLESSTSTKLYDETTPTSPYNPPDYTGCENLVLYACYSPTTAAVNILDHNLWTIDIANFTATKPSGAGVTSTDVGDTSQIDLDLAESGAGPVLWTIAYTADQKTAKVKWTSVNCSIRRSSEKNSIASYPCSAVDDDGCTVTTPLASYLEGKYAVTFYAYTALRDEPYTYTIYVNITSSATAP